MSSKYEFIKDFVESDMQFEDFDASQLEFLKEQIVELDIHVDIMDERTFYKVKRTLNDVYSKTSKIVEANNNDKEESEEITMSKSVNTNNVTINNNNNMEDDTMRNINVAVTEEELTMGEKAKAFAEGAKEKLTDGFKFVTENVDVAAEEVKKMANMSDRELEEYLKTNSKSVLDRIVDAVKKYSGKMKDNAEFFPNLKNRADKADNIIELIKEVLDEEELSGWGKFKAIVKELVKWLVRLLLKVGAIVLKIAFTLVVGTVKIGATALVTAGRTLGVVNREVIKPTVNAGKTAWANHKARKSEADFEDDFDDDFDVVEEMLFED